VRVQIQPVRTERLGGGVAEERSKVEE